MIQNMTEKFFANKKSTGKGLTSFAIVKNDASYAGHRSAWYFKYRI